MRQDLDLILDRMTFGRAESWCRAQAHMTTPKERSTELEPKAQPRHIGGVLASTKKGQTVRPVSRAPSTRG
jgi:hypothetical protein